MAEAMSASSFSDGTQSLIADRLARRKGHFMPPGLLDSQFKTLEPPAADENPVTVSIDASVETIVDDIVRQLKLGPAMAWTQQEPRMTRIALVVSDVDGTLLTKDKILTDGARAAVRRLHEAGIGFTITSSRPTIGMRFLIEPLQITLPVGAFNGSCDRRSAAEADRAASDPGACGATQLSTCSNEFGVDIWLFTSDLWLTRNGDGEYVPNEKRAIRADPTIVADFTPYLASACKIVGASADAALLQRCEIAMQQALGAQATAVRSQSYYLDVTPPGCNKGTFVQTMAGRLGIPLDAVATIGDMQNDLAMFRTSGVSFAMGNATDDVKKMATHVTASNEDEGFARAIEMILKGNGVR